MAEQFGRVMPGDLIRAGDMNRILDTLDALERRVSRLEAVNQGDTGVVITRPLPSDPVSVIVGSQLTVEGRNFALPEENVVTIENTRVTQFKSGSSATRLIFDIPPIPEVVGVNRKVVLTVSNTQGS